MKYHIAAVARLTNLSIDVIRSWERRYKLVVPERDAGGVRLYGESDVARLTLARAATQLGHPIRRVAQMSDAELKAIVETRPSPSHDVHAGVVDRVLGALHGNDVALAAQTLASAALLLPTRDLVLSVLAPALRRVGEQWEQGQAAVWQEHLLSTLVRNVVGTAPHATPNGRSMLLATPPFDHHAFGIGLAAMLATSHGIAACNLGTVMPAEHVIAAARRLNPNVVVIGFTLPSSPLDEALAYAKALDERLPDTVQLWLGAELGEAAARAMGSKRVRGAPTLEEFDRLCAIAS